MAKLNRRTKHGEPTKDVTVTLTETAIANLDGIANSLNMSRSELITRIGLGQIPLKLEAQLQGECCAN
jgi:hypothetical protein